MLEIIGFGSQRLQHGFGRKNEAKTARNPYFIGISRGDPSRIRTT
jgi:hypothetical protein